MAPLEGGLVGDATQLGARLDGHVPGHEPDEVHPRREVLLAVLEVSAEQDAEEHPALGASELSVPDQVLPSLAVRGDPQRGQPGCGRNASAASSKVP